MTTARYAIDGLVFDCENDAERWRAHTLLSKEPGTIEWLGQLGPGDVLYDVGANIGCYTLYGARRVGVTGIVYAFEPHVATAATLLRNVEANGFTDRVRVLTCALHRADAVLPFGYRSLRAGMSGSQLGHCIGEDGQPFVPLAIELKASKRLSALIAAEVIRPPTAVKIDVDGNELDILFGLFEPALPVAQYPRQIQVEVRAANRQAVDACLVSFGYRHVGEHHTASGVRALAQGTIPAALSANAVYVNG